MAILLICIIAQFSFQYKNFVNSPQSRVIFTGLTRRDYKISEFANDPVVLWFWRSYTGSAEVDSLIKKIKLRRNFHLGAVLRWESQDINDYPKQVNKLHLSAHFDSSAIETFLSFISLGIKHRNLSQIKTGFSLPVLSDFRNQLFIITNLGILIFAVLFMSGVVYILVKTIYYLPALSHQLGPRKHVQFFDTIKSLILLIPILILRNIYIIFICYSFLLILTFTTREKNWLRFTFILLLLMFILSLPLNNFISFLRENNSNYKLYEIVNYDTHRNTELSSDKGKVFLAYSLKQQGRLEESLSLYEDLYYHDNRDIATVNNLANIYYLYDECARAETLYNYAILSEDRGEPYFNLGLLKLKNIEYLASSKYMEEARKRNFSSLNKEPVDIKPSNRDFYKIIFSEKLKLNGIVKTIYIIPIIIALAFSFLPFKLSPPFFCATCGRPICADCMKQDNEETICDDCFTKFKSTKKDEIEVERRMSVGKTRKKVKTIILYAINILIPGAGLIYLKKHFIGLLLVCLVMFGYIPFFFPGIFVKPTGWVALSHNSITFSIALLCAIISYLISFSIIRGSYAD